MASIQSQRMPCLLVILAVVCHFSSSSFQCMGFLPSQQQTKRNEVCWSSSRFYQSFNNDDQQLQDTNGGAVFDALSNEDLPDDIPKDVSREAIEDTIYNQDQTLYEILGAAPTATRPELKKCYVELAKLTHPDAQIGTDGGGLEIDVDFSEVAAAWRVLGDSKTRKRYDRDLKAQAFSETAQRFANERLEKAVPAVAAMMDKVAVPFLRRTTATTWAVGKAVANGVSKIRSSNVQEDYSPTDTFLKAIQAGQQAGRVIDSIELNEQSTELEERAKKEQVRAEQVQEELDAVTEQRLFGTLQSPNFALSSDEAKQVLERLDIEDTVSIVDRAMLRNTIEREIKCLQEAELQFSERLEQYESTDRDWNEWLQVQEGAKQDLSERKGAEIEARKALVGAQRMVAEAKAHLVVSSNALRGVEQQVRKNAHEMDRVTSALSRKQEKVRTALKKKADIVSGGIQVDYLTEEDLTSLRRKEIQLLGEGKQVARMVARLQSRSEKLMSRAEALERWQESGQTMETELTKGGLAALNGVNVSRQQ